MPRAPANQRQQDVPPPIHQLCALIGHFKSSLPPVVAQETNLTFDKVTFKRMNSDVGRIRRKRDPENKPGHLRKSKIKKLVADTKIHAPLFPSSLCFPLSHSLPFLPILNGVAALIGKFRVYKDKTNGR